MKKSFKLYYDSLDVLSDLSDEQAGQLLRAIVKYETEGEEILEGLMKAVFTPFKNNIDRAKEAYEKACERNKANGSKGGRPKAEKTHSVNLGLEKTDSNPKKADKDKDKDKDKDITPLPYQVISAYKEYVSKEHSKVVESSTMKELRIIKHDLYKVLIGIKNYGSTIEDQKYIIKLDNFIRNKIYLDHQVEKKQESKLEGWK